MLTVLLFAVVVLMVSAPPRVADAAAVRIMPVGDSITDGYNVPGGYRIDLEDVLVADGYEFDFVGSLANGPASLVDRQHEGHTGLRIDELAVLIEESLARHRPDVVLLKIGTNDILQSHNLAQAPQRLSDLVDRITRAAPSATILVSSLAPLGDQSREARARDYNAAIAAIVRDKTAQGKRVEFVDIHTALTTADLADGVHPNPTGYRKMAMVWRAALPATPAVVAPLPPADAPKPPPVLATAPPVTPAGPSVTTPRRLVRLGGHRLRADRRGGVLVRIGCHAAASADCSGVVRLRALRGPRSQRRLATRPFRVAPAQAARVRLRLNRREMHRLRRRAVTPVSVEATVKHEDGSRQVTRTVTRLEVR